MPTFFVFFCLRWIKVGRLCSASRRWKEIISHTPTQSGPEFLRHQTCDPCCVQDAQLPREEIYFLASEEWAYLEDFFFLLWIRVDFAQDASLVRSPSCACVVAAEATAICSPRQNAQISDAAHYPAAEETWKACIIFCFYFFFAFLFFFWFCCSPHATSLGRIYLEKERRSLKQK